MKMAEAAKSGDDDSAGASPAAGGGPGPGQAGRSRQQSGTDDDETVDLIRGFTCLQKTGILFLTILVFAAFVGAIIGFGYWWRAFDDEFQKQLLWRVVVPLLVASAFCIFVAMVMQDNLSNSFLQNMSDGDDAVKRAVQSSAANISIVCALVLTCTIPLMFVDAPESNDVDKIFVFYWYYGLASIAASNAFAGMIMGVLVLMYTDPLSNDSTLAFIRRFKGAIGLPFALLIGACIFLMVAFVCYTMFLYDKLFAICHAAEFLGVAFCVTLFQHECGKYTNKEDSFGDYEKNLLGSREAKKKRITRTQYLNGLTPAALAKEMKKIPDLKEAGDAFESQLIDGAMLKKLTYDIVTDILNRHMKAERKKEEEQKEETERKMEAEQEKETEQEKEAERKKEAKRHPEELRVGNAIKVCSRLGVSIG